MVRQGTWRKGLAVLLLLAAVVVFGALNRVKESAIETQGQLVFTNQFMPSLPGEGPASGESVASAERVGNGARAGNAEMAELFAAEEVAPAMASPTPSERNPEFDAYRASRLQNRARRMETVQRLLDSDELDEASRKALQDEMLALSEYADLEERAEGLLVARGLYDAVVMINQSDADVIVSNRITRDQAGQIGGVVARVAGVPLNRITIVDGALADGAP